MVSAPKYGTLFEEQGEFINPLHQALTPIKHTFTIQTEVEDYANSTRPSVLINLPLRCEILFFADLHEFGGEPVGLKGQRSLSCLYRVWNDKTKVCQEIFIGFGSFPPLKMSTFCCLSRSISFYCRRVDKHTIYLESVLQIMAPSEPAV